MSLILAIVFIAPLIYTSNFIFLSGDDYCRATIPFSEYGKSLKEWFLFHNGRYINSIFALLPVYEITTYRILLAFQFLIFGFVLFRFISISFKAYGINTSSSFRILMSVLFYILIVAKVPSLYEMYFWYASVTAYLFSIMFLLPFLGLLLQFYFTRKLNFFFLAILTVLLNGNNEMLLGVTNFLLLLLFVRERTRDKMWNWRLLLLNVISWVSSLVAILAPGTQDRRNQFSYGGEFFSSVKVAILYGAKFIVESFISFPVIIFSIGLFLFVYQKVRYKEGKSIPPVALAVISYVSIISLFFVIFYAKGLLGVYGGRIGNMVISVVLIFLFLNILNFAIFLRQKRSFKLLDSRGSVFIFLLIFLAVITFKNQNYINLRKDLTENRLEKYKIEMEERITFLEVTTQEQVLLEPIERTLILKSDDVALARQEWLRSCYLKLIKEKNSRVKKIEIPEPGK